MTLWILCLALPLPLFIIIGELQVHLETTIRHHALLRALLDSISIIALLLLLGIPLWITKLVKASKQTTK
jgi:hypothetical protein